MNIEGFLQHRQQRINTFLYTILPTLDSIPTHLHQAMHYVVLNGGKRIRPLLVYATGEAFGLDSKLLDFPAGAIELIHAYSLVHDDLPAMDNDDLRRGLPTCHKAFDEATAILVGDALQALAFNVLAERDEFLNPHIRIAMISCLTKAAGSRGMAGGQALDLKATGQALNQEELKHIHQLKTGALIAASVQLGILAAQIDDRAIIDLLMNFANNIGLCFQIKDDILNSEGSSRLLGKDVGTDASKQKATYTTIAGLDTARESLQYHYDQAIAALSTLGLKVATLRALADYIIKRNH
jgi:geranylgeranyl pyrophosphate synthase